MPETVAAIRRLEVVAYDADGLGDRSYLLHDGGKAFVVDPQRHPGPYIETANPLGLDIVLVLETHVHNDYVSGGLALARRASATYGVPAGVPFDFATYFGWVVPFASPFVVASPSSDELLECRRSLSRIGREVPAGWTLIDDVWPPPAGLLGHYEVASFQALGQRFRQGRPACVIDVRFPHEWDMAHLKDAQNIPLPEVASAAASLSTDTDTWVHCAAGYRAAIAASILSAHGLRPVLVDDASKK